MYVGVVFANDESITNDEQNLISDQLVQTNCRYAVCAGHKCSTWDDSVDWAYLVTVNYEPNDDAFVMTSWHTDESVQDVIFFALHCTNFDDHDFQRYLVLAVGPRPDLRGAILRGIRSVWYSDFGDLSGERSSPASVPSSGATRPSRSASRRPHQ
jgi:hypothetical protein